MRHFVDDGFQRVNSQRTNGNRSVMAVFLAIAVNYLEGPFLDVEGFKGVCSVPCVVCRIQLVFLALSLRKNKPTGLSDKERVMVRRFFPGGFILDGPLARDRHAKPDGLFPALDETALAVPVLQGGNWAYWNLAQRALKQRGKLIAD
jgi:hypothetical protein